MLKLRPVGRTITKAKYPSLASLAPCVTRAQKERGNQETAKCARAEMLRRKGGDQKAPNRNKICPAGASFPCCCSWEALERQPSNRGGSTPQAPRTQKSRQAAVCLLPRHFLHPQEAASPQTMTQSRRPTWTPLGSPWETPKPLPGETCKATAGA